MMVGVRGVVGICVVFIIVGSRDLKRRRAHTLLDNPFTERCKYMVGGCEIIYMVGGCEIIIGKWSGACHPLHHNHIISEMDN
jgi:hypothetical protein